MAKAPTDIRTLARAHTETALNVLAGIMREPQSAPAARVAAAQALLDRGWGKAAQAIAGADGEGPLTLTISWASSSEVAPALLEAEDTQEQASLAQLEQDRDDDIKT